MTGEFVGLITLGVGYTVFTNATREKKTVKFLGQGIGILIMIASLLALVCASMKCAMMGGCPFSQKSKCRTMDKAMCPFMKT